MTDQYDKEAKRLAPEIRAKMDACKQDSPGAGVKERMRTAASEIIQLLLAAGLAFMEKVPAAYCAVHPANRCGLGAVAADVHELLSMILRQGFIMAEVLGRVWAYQRNPKAPKSKDQMEFNRRLAEQSGGLLAAPNPEARVLTIAGTHTTQGARCVLHETKGIKSEVPGKPGQPSTLPIDIWDDDGKIVKSKVASSNKAYLELVDPGPEVTIIRWQVDVVIPELANFLSLAANRGHGTERIPTKLQVCLQICSMYEAAVGDDEEMRWAAVKSNLLNASWLNDREVADCLLFVQKWSGGTANPWLLQEVAQRAYSRQQVVDIPTGVLGKMGALTGMSGCSRYIRAVLIAIQDAPVAASGEKRVTSNLYGTGDLEAASKDLKPKVQKMCQLLEEADEWLKSSGLPEATQQKAYTDLSTRLANFTHSKKFATRRTFKTVGEIQEAFLSDLALAEGCPSAGPKAWGKLQKGQPAQPEVVLEKPKKPVGLEYTPDGQVTEASLQKNGLSKDVSVRGPDGNFWKITRLSGGMAFLTRVNADETTKVSYNKLLDEYPVDTGSKIQTMQLEDVIRYLPG